MKTLHFKISIKASPERVWTALWNEENYQRWTSAFCSGSFYKTDNLCQGSTIHFLTTEGHGMFGVIDKLEEFKIMQFKHLGEIKDFKELPINEETAAWSGAKERYVLNNKEDETLLEVFAETDDRYIDFMNSTFDKALSIVKAIAEG